MGQQRAVGGEGPGGLTQATHQVIRGGAPGPQLLHRAQRQPLVLATHRRHRPLVFDPNWDLPHLGALHLHQVASAGVPADNGLRVELGLRVAHLILVHDELPGLGLGHIWGDLLLTRSGGGGHCVLLTWLVIHAPYCHVSVSPAGTCPPPAWCSPPPALPGSSGSPQH